MELKVTFGEYHLDLDVEFDESIKIEGGNTDTAYELGYNEGYVEGKTDGYSQGFSEGLNQGYKDGINDGYQMGVVEGLKITEDATATADHIDYRQTAYAKGEKITGTKHRREYKGTIASEVKGYDAYATLATDNLLAEIRTLDTLFVRVEFDVEPTSYTIVKTWASNVDGGVMPTIGHQLVHRLDASAKTSFSNILRTIHEEPITSVGLLHITENGELRAYSGSLNYAIRPCNFKVIVEW